MGEGERKNRFLRKNTPLVNDKFLLPKDWVSEPDHTEALLDLPFLLQHNNHQHWGQELYIKLDFGIFFSPFSGHLGNKLSEGSRKI